MTMCRSRSSSDHSSAQPGSPISASREAPESRDALPETLLIWAHWTLLRLGAALVRLCHERERQDPAWTLEAASLLLERAKEAHRGGRIGRVPASVVGPDGGPARDFNDPMRVLYLLRYCPERLGVDARDATGVGDIISMRNHLAHEPGKLRRGDIERLMRKSRALANNVGAKDAADRIRNLERLLRSQEHFPFRPGHPPASTLYVVPCSAKKVTTDGVPPSAHHALRESLSTELGDRLDDARRRRVQDARIDTTRGLLPAYRRYGEGSLWKGGGPPLSEAIQRGASHVLILSGGYGVLRWDDPIGHYDSDLRREEWPSDLLESVIADYAQRNRIQTAIGLFNGRFPSYSGLFRSALSSSSVPEVVLLEPLSLGGSPAESDHAIGEALRELLEDGEIIDGWRSSTETVLSLTRIR